MNRTKWFERKFALIEDNGILPYIIERLEGTHSRLSEKAKNLSKEIGHLIDLEQLRLARVEGFATNKQELTPADLTNKKTHEANHNERK